MKLSVVRPKAVIFGVLADIGGSVVVGIVLGIVIAMIAGGASREHIAEIRSNAIIKIVGLAGTLTSTGAGGYIAARVAWPDWFENSFAVGLIDLVLSIALAFIAPGITPVWKITLGIILAIPAALIGGKRASRGTR